MVSPVEVPVKADAALDSREDASNATVPKQKRTKKRDADNLLIETPPYYLAIPVDSAFRYYFRKGTAT